MAITVLDIYDMYAGDKSDAGVCSGVFIDFYVRMGYASPYGLETCSK
jgi:hypothetical protein